VEHLSVTSVICEVRVVQSVVFCVEFVTGDCLSFALFSFHNCIVCPSMYRF
jgi:hypothetical protein